MRFFYGKAFFQVFLFLWASCSKKEGGNVFRPYYVQLFKNGHGKIDVHFLFTQFQIETKSWPNELPLP